MPIKFRNYHPCRKYTGFHSNYRKYKPFLAEDFFRRCGYTDSPDCWFGGKNNFHIDHFIPWKNHPKNPELKTAYANLVYSCSYVNILKSNDEGSYLDPCDTDFNLHFQRGEDGHIIPITKEAMYMHTKLKLYLKRYEVIWMLENLYNKMCSLTDIINKAEEGEFKTSLLITLGELSTHFINYWKYLRHDE